jgi:hypothetical protein
MELTTGDALVIGGVSVAGYERRAFEYHFATNSWSDAGTMLEASSRPPAVRLLDGRVLTIGGPGVDDFLGDAPELYDPASNRWYAAGVEPLAAYDSSLFLLPNGSAMAAGGDLYAAGGGTEGGSVLFSTEIYTPGPTPTVSGLGVTNLTQTAATISGAYDMSTASVKDCEVLISGYSTPCQQPAGGSPGSGVITAVLLGLQPSTTYGYELSLSDGAVITTTAEQSFTTLPATTPPGKTPPPPAAMPHACVVPRLKGMHFAVARRALRRARCAIGKLTKTHALRLRLRRHPRSPEIVVRQFVPAGTRHPAGTPVNLTLGLPARHSARKRPPTRGR